MRVRPSVGAQRRRGGAAVPPAPSSHPLVGALSGVGTVSANLVVPSGGEWPPRQLAGITLATENNFPGTITPSGWAYTPRFTEVAYVEDATKPFGLGVGTGEWRYVEGMGAGNNDPGVVGTSAVSGRREVYVALLVKHSVPFQEQIPATKFCHFNMSGGQNAYLQKFSPTQNWPEQYGPVAGQWVLGTTGWGGSDDGLPFQEFNNISTTAALVDYSGAWQTVEVHLRFSSTASAFDGIVRQWVNGELTAEHTAVRWPAGSFEWAPDAAGTYGGGALTVPSAQHFRIGNFWVGQGAI